VAAPESSLVGRQGPEPWDTWQHRSPPEQGGGVRYHGTRGSVGALPSREAGSGAMRHVVAPEPSRAGRWDLELQGMWSYVLLLVLDLSLYAGVPGLQGIDRLLNWVTKGAALWVGNPVLC
jgi:hypothetical protein